MEEFQDGLKLGGVADLRFKNGLVGSIFREEIALEIYARLGYPAAKATFAWVGNNVWGPGISVPYTLVEVYKKAFCDDRPDLFPDGCVNMWELVGDFGSADFSLPSNCQFASCDAARVKELEALVVATPPGPGFKDATSAYLDWDSVHRFQCLSWILWTGDDALHNMNNVVLVERGDGHFQYLPYSVDISGGQEWYQLTPLYGANTIARGCQGDEACWSDTIAACEATIADFAAIDPAGLVDEVYGRLEKQGMLRDGDVARYEQIRAWYEKRVDDLPTELELFRAQPCEPPNAMCDGACVPVEQCAPVCKGDDLPCMAFCAPPGKCDVCDYPFTWCSDGSCRPEALCPK
jgi:hypothetical protein